MTIDESQQDIIDQFADIDDWMDKYAYIIDMGNSLPALPEQLKTPDRLIEGCQSRVWYSEPTPTLSSSRASYPCSCRYSRATPPTKY